MAVPAITGECCTGKPHTVCRKCTHLVVWWSGYCKCVILFPTPLSLCDKYRTFPHRLTCVCFCGYLVSQSETDTLTQLAFIRLMRALWKWRAHIQVWGVLIRWSITETVLLCRGMRKGSLISPYLCFSLCTSSLTQCCHSFQHNTRINLWELAVFQLGHH